MKKITTAILSVLLAFAFVLAGCAADKSDITVTIAGEKDGKVSTVYTGAAIVPDITVSRKGRKSPLHTRAREERFTKVLLPHPSMPEHTPSRSPLRETMRPMPMKERWS